MGKGVQIYLVTQRWWGGVGASPDKKRAIKIKPRSLFSALGKQNFLTLSHTIFQLQAKL